MHELNPPIFTPAHATKSRGLFNGFHQLHSFSKVLFFPPCCTRFFFFHQHLPRPPSHPSLIFILSSFFFFFFFLLCLSLPLTTFPRAFSARIFPLSSSISLCITLSQPNGITGEHVPLSGSALDDILTYRCEVNEMEYRSDPLSSPSLPLPAVSSSLRPPRPLFSFKTSLLFPRPCCPLCPDSESLFLVVLRNA